MLQGMTVDQAKARGLCPRISGDTWYQQVCGKAAKVDGICNFHASVDRRTAARRAKDQAANDAYFAQCDASKARQAKLTLLGIHASWTADGGVKLSAEAADALIARLEGQS
jgi:hypothetical protein